MPLDKGWRIVIRFALMGLAAGFTVGTFAALASHSNALVLLILFCPAMRFPPHFPWADAPIWLLFTVIPIVNGVLYAIVGVIVGALIAGLTGEPK
jgi:hypothetical protein